MRLSKWTVEALLLSDELAKLIARNQEEEVTGTVLRNVDRQSAEERKATVPLLATAKVTTSKIPVGSYIATCTGIIEDSIPESNFNPDIYRFYFDVDGKKDEEGNQATTDAISSRALSPKSKLWDWLVAFGLRPEVGKVIDLESVIGRKVMIVVEAHGEYTRVGKLVPLPEGMAQPANDDAPFDTEPKQPLADALAEAAALSEWFERVKAIGFTPKEILDHSVAMTGKTPKDLTPDEREQLSKSMGV